MCSFAIEVWNYYVWQQLLFCFLEKINDAENPKETHTCHSMAAFLQWFCILLLHRQNHLCATVWLKCIIIISNNNSVFISIECQLCGYFVVVFFCNCVIEICNLILNHSKIHIFTAWPEFSIDFVCSVLLVTWIMCKFVDDILDLHL